VPSRLTLAQAFNSVATMIGPQFGAFFILAHVASPPAGATAAALAGFRRQEAHVFVAPFIGIALALLGLALLCWRVRRWSPPVAEQTGGSFLRLLGHKRLMLGALSIFTYVGAEVAIGSSIINYLMQGAILGVAAQTAGRLVSFYWGGAMVGRFIGAYVLSRVPPGLALTVCALAAGTLATASGLSSGGLAAASLLAIGLFNSIQFPTIFTLAIEGLGKETPEASGIICLAIVGGAVVPLLTGYVADRAGLSHALAVPVICYVWIALYGAMVWRGALQPRLDGVPPDPAPG
jgi:FHS family L-fucose permease-like MFS transporter